ncbi:hypothetical protein [Bacillus thuringiensis]
MGKYELKIIDNKLVIDLNEIKDEYKNGGEYGWCGEVRAVLKPPHMFDFSLKEKMCKYCGVHDKEMFT